MGATIYSLLSPYSFLMGVLWFSFFTLLSLGMRKLRSPIKFSVVPLTVLLVLSLLRMVLPLGMSGATIIRSEVLFPVIVNFLRYEITTYRVLGIPLSLFNAFILVWICVSLGLLIRLFQQYKKIHHLIKVLAGLPRDERAESILAEISGAKKSMYVYRTYAIRFPMTAGIKRSIFLPDVDYTNEELRVILKHEWKHYQDKDVFAKMMINIISAVFWWNPLVYILKRNVSFALELKCDYFATSEEGDYDYFEDGLRRLARASTGDTPIRRRRKWFLDSNEEGRDRLKALGIHTKSPSKRMLVNICSCVFMGLLFLSSYMFIVLPAHWESHYEHVGTIEHPDYYYSEEAYRAEENFIVDNGDGTFSLYIDGQLVEDVGEINPELFAFLPMRARED